MEIMNLDLLSIQSPDIEKIVLIVKSESDILLHCQMKHFSYILKNVFHTYNDEIIVLLENIFSYAELEFFSRSSLE